MYIYFYIFVFICSESLFIARYIAKGITYDFIGKIINVRVSNTSANPYKNLLLDYIESDKWKTFNSRNIRLQS